MTTTDENGPGSARDDVLRRIAVTRQVRAGRGLFGRLSQCRTARHDSVPQN
ncbi:hypothetical protein ACFV1A_00510 [Streptomyces seoulensis]|uniref:hypothetical protein n=1 Tax=Streptomyces seoulensis TaxID=73044 RepID=UPI000B01F1FE|nr:hypothetical protein [Streptomyces seoulensis]